MSQNCFICNSAVTNPRNCVNIFGKDSQVQSKKKICQALSGVLEKNVVENTCHSRVLCRKCFTSLTEYDSLQQRLQVLKSSFLLRFKSTLAQYNLKYETYGQPVNIKPKKIVLPASKLHPLPPNYMIDVSKISSVAKSNIAFANLESNGMAGIIRIEASTSAQTSTAPSLVTTAQPRLLVASANATTPATTTLDMASITPNVTTNVTTNVTPTVTKNPMLSFDLTSLSKNFMASAIANNAVYIKASDSDQNAEDSKDNSEIDMECTLAVTSDENGKLLFNTEEDKSKPTEPKSNFFDMSLLLSDSITKDDKSKFLLDRYTLMGENAAEDDDDDEAQQTIVMTEGDEATIIRVPAGQRFLYHGQQLALVQKSSDDLQDDEDSPDSNDGFELQVSEDEETAKAIIAAAQEQGTAYIKVESGEMYRVQSIRSKTDDDSAENSTAQLQKMVDRRGDVFVCLLCENKPLKNKFEADAEPMMYHLKSVHGARVYICPVCDIVVRKRSEYTAHLEGHNHKFIKLKYHECALCTKKFNSKKLLAEHLNVHTGSRPYACGACDKTFASKYTLHAHQKTHSARPRPFKCKQCEKTFFTAQNLAQHEKTHLGIKEFICNVCDKAFATQHNLEVHGVIHTGRKPFDCPVCTKAFARRAELRDHMRIHTGERPFACDICGATFSQRSNLHSHKRATHLDDKRYACLQCPKRFKRRRLLDYHIKAAHTGERPLKCNVCRATFVYPEHYKKHKRIHSGEKPYDCEVCGKSFNSRDNRNTHRFVHSDKKPYECLTCGTGYMRKQLLYQHMNTTGHVAESIVVNQPRVIKTTDNGITAPLVDVHGIEIKTNKLTDTIFETNLHYESDGTAVVGSNVDATKLFLSNDKKIIVQEKPTLNLVQDGEDPTFLTLHNLTGLIGTTSDDKLDDQAQIITTDDKGGAMRLIQVQLQDGQTGWVAINHDQT